MAWLGLLAELAIGLALVYGVGVAFVARMLTHPPRRGYAFALAKGWASTPMELSPALGGPRAFERWTFRSRDNELAVWDIRGDGGADAPLVIFSHGWGESRLHGLWRLQAVTSVASRVILWDMAGHGESAGTCTLGTREVDDLCALIHAIGELPRAGIVLHGFSLGAGVSIAAAARLTGENNSAGARVKIAGVIAEAPYRVAYTPAAAVLGALGLPARTLLWPALAWLGVMWRLGAGLAWFVPGASASRWFDRALLAEALARAGVPLMVIHGDDDAVCPLADGSAIASAARGGDIASADKSGLKIISGAAHLTLWTQDAQRAECAGAVTAFIAECSSHSRERAV